MTSLLGGWQNPVTYSGVPGKDKSRAWYYQRRYGSDYLLEDIANSYTRDDVVQKIARSVPEEMLSRGYEIWQGPENGGERREDLEDALGPRGLDLDSRLFEVLVWERLGGGALLLGADDGRDKTEPLVDDEARGFHFLHDLERRDVQGNLQRDRVLRLSFYKGTIPVHRSRLILFPGAPIPRREAMHRLGWGSSAVENAWDEIAAFHAAWSDFRAQLPDGNQGVLYIQDLLGLLSNEDGARNLQRRVAEIDKYRSILRSLVLDSGGERFERLTTNLTGYADAIRLSFDRLSMATSIPKIVLLGESAPGMNTTDQGPLTIWYDKVARERKRKAEPAILRVARIQSVAMGVNPEGLRVEWPPFWQPTAKERAEVAKAETEVARAKSELADKAMAANAITPDEHRTLVRSALGLED